MTARNKGRNEGREVGKKKGREGRMKEENTGGRKKGNNSLEISKLMKVSTKRLEQMYETKDKTRNEN